MTRSFRRGFGETGSFCALVNLIARMETEHRVDVLRAVKDLKDANIRLVEDTVGHEALYLIVWYRNRTHIYLWASS